MERLKELKKEIENIKLTYNYDETYSNLYNACIDYMNDTQELDFEYIFEDYFDYDTINEIAKNELENGGIIRLYYFMGNATNFNNEIFKLNGYGNLEEFTFNDLEYIKEEILQVIEEKSNNNKD